MMELKYGTTTFGNWIQNEMCDRVLRLFKRDEPDEECSYVKIHNAIETPNDLLLEIEYDPWEDKHSSYKEYEFLSNIMLAYSDTDQVDNQKRRNK